jgi:ribosomal protein S25
METAEMLCEIKSYLDTQQNFVTSKTISKRTGIKPKITRYLIRTYLDEYTVKKTKKHLRIKMDRDV